jgi:hypothetical protein
MQWGPPALFFGMTIYACSCPLFKKMALVGNALPPRNISNGTNESKSLQLYLIDQRQSELRAPAVADSRVLISPCNVLFTGNVLATVPTAIVFHRDFAPRKLKVCLKSPFQPLLLLSPPPALRRRCRWADQNHVFGGLLQLPPPPSAVSSGFVACLDRFRKNQLGKTIILN